MHAFQVAIDGPVAAGKTTIARLAAEKLHFLYIDTGAMYRALALAARTRGIDWNDEPVISALASSVQIDLKKPAGSRNDGRPVTVYLDGEDVSWSIRTQDVAEGASLISQYAQVREVLVARQQEIADNHNVIMEGRDIGTRVLPEARLKIFLTADVETRVKRDIARSISLNQPTDADAVRKALLKRDEREMNRAIDPLRPAADAWKLDTTNLSVGEVAALVTVLAKLRRKA